MNSETMDTTNSTGTGAGTTGLNGIGAQARVQSVADKAHQAVDSMAQTLNTGAERVIGWHDEYGEMAREQIRANPLAVVFGAFALGYVFAKLTK